MNNSLLLKSGSNEKKNLPFLRYMPIKYPRLTIVNSRNGYNFLGEVNSQYLNTQNQ